MTPELHPTLYELVPSVTYSIVSKFKGWVDPDEDALGDLFRQRLIFP